MILIVMIAIVITVQNRARISLLIDAFSKFVHLAESLNVVVQIPCGFRVLVIK